MRCRICHADLTVRGYRQHGTRRVPLYHPCPRLEDSLFHPADRSGPWSKGSLQFSHRRLFKNEAERRAYAKETADRFLAKCDAELSAGRTKGAEKMRVHAQHWAQIAEGKRVPP